MTSDAMIFPPRNRPLTDVGAWLRKRFPIRAYVQMGCSPSTLYPSHWTFSVFLFGLFALTFTRPFKSPAVDPWWAKR